MVESSSIELLDRAARACSRLVGGTVSTSHQPGSYVTHAKLLELGSGQVISSDKGTIRIRFASGERNFLIEAVRGFLAVSEQGPERSSRAARSKTKRKA